MSKFLSREFRKYLYSLSIAAVPILVHYGIIDVEASVLILPLVVALLNLTPADTASAATSQVVGIPETDSDVEVVDEVDDDIEEVDTSSAKHAA